MTSERVHATTVSIGGRGVMLMGASGAGKSDLALRLIDRGAVLVSDDYTVVEAVDGAAIASPPATIAGRIEVRGIGIVATRHIERATVALVIDLGGVVERMPEARSITVAEVEIPAVSLDALESSAPIKVEFALARLVKDRR